MNMKDFRTMKRQRGRNRKPSGQSHNPNRAYDSNGPEGIKVRGNSQTVYEKYQQLARDANASGDRVLAEAYLQHAEHYFRLIRITQPQRPISEFVQRDPFSTGYEDFDDDSFEPAERPKRLDLRLLALMSALMTEAKRRERPHPKSLTATQIAKLIVIKAAIPIAIQIVKWPVTVTALLDAKPAANAMKENANSASPLALKAKEANLNKAALNQAHSPQPHPSHP